MAILWKVLKSAFECEDENIPEMKLFRHTDQHTLLTTGIQKSASPYRIKGYAEQDVFQCITLKLKFIF